MNDLWESYRHPERGFTSAITARNWPEGLLIGNGTVGAIMMGHPQKECLIVNHEELFLPLFRRMPVLEMRTMLPELRDLARAGRYEEAQSRVIDAARAAGYPEDFIMTDPTHPAFDLLIDTGPYEEVENYIRSVNFATGEASVSFCDRTGARWLKRCFVSRTDGVLLFRIDCDRAFDADILLAPRPTDSEPWDAGRTSSGNIPKGAFVAHGIRSIERLVTGGELRYKAAYAHSSGGYSGVARVSTSTGKIEEQGVGVRVSGATSIDIISAVSPMADADSCIFDELGQAVDRCNGSYDDASRRNAAVHGELFGRVNLSLGENAAKAITTSEDLIEEAQANGPTPAYIQLLFDACRYNILCSSGRLPPNLQGVWSGTWTPHWSGDYTLDANVQAAIAHYLSCGTPELMLTLFELMDRMMPDFRENARALYDARGIFVNSRVSTTGLQQRYNTCPVYFWTAGAAWLAHYYYDYYLYTGDVDFLKNRALPFMTEAAWFFEDFLTENRDGSYELVPSMSPENRPANSDCLVTINATMDVAALRELLQNLLDASSVVPIDNSQLTLWKDMLEKLPEYSANTDGALKEWLDDSLEDNYEHRHMSHLYPLYPGSEADLDTWPELHEMALQAFRKRMEHYNPREYGGFGLYHVAAAAARAGDAATAWEAIQHIAQWHVYSGMGTSHNYGPTIFNVDASGGVPAALVEMLVVSRPGKMQVLPAVPRQLSTGCIEGVRCHRRITVEKLEWNFSTSSSATLRLRSDISQEVEVVVSDRGQNVLIRTGTNSRESHGLRTTVSLYAGKSFEIQLEWR